MEKIMEKVAAGLRNMKKKPDVLFFVDGVEDWTWDVAAVCGIPVYHTYFFPSEVRSDMRWRASMEKVLFFPAWRKDQGDVSKDMDNFINGYLGEG